MISTEIWRRVYTDYRVSAAIQQPLEGGKKDAANIVSRVVRLGADAQHAGFAHRVSVPGNIPDLGRGQNQIFVAHDFGDRRGHFRCNRPLQSLEVRLTRGVVKDVLAEFAHRQGFDRLERFLVVRFEN